MATQAAETLGRGLVIHGLSVALLLLLAGRVVAFPPGSEAGSASFSMCLSASHRSEADALVVLRRGLALAEEAIRRDTDDAAAYVAAFCNLGKQMELSGITLRAAIDVERMRRWITRATELAPNDADVLAARGAFLYSLPSLFGGNPDEGERLLQRALLVDPDNRRTREFLTSVASRRLQN